MKSRESILAKINSLASFGAEHPGEFHSNKSTMGDLLEDFQQALATVGAISKVVTKEQFNEAIEEIHPGKFVYSSNKVLTNGIALSDVDVLVIEGQLGVAENGAIWICEKQLPHRVAPFICQHLIIQIAKKDLIANMHAAYQQLGENHSGFGLFLAGPSKTADIEQSLVIGAHGARSLVVLIIQ